MQQPQVTREQHIAALRSAIDAGDNAAANEIAAQIDAMDAQSPPPQRPWDVHPDIPNPSGQQYAPGTHPNQWPDVEPPAPVPGQPRPRGKYFGPDDFAAAGGMTGAMLAMPGGPPAMMLGAGIGGAIGDRLGKLYYDPTGEHMGPATDEVVDTAKAGLKEGVLFGGGEKVVEGIKAIPPVVGGVLGQKAYQAGRLHPSAERSVRGETFGVDLSRGDVSTQGLIRGTQNVLGRTPLIGKLFTDSTARKGAQLGQAKGRMLDDLAPGAAKTSVGRELVEAGKQKYSFMKDFFGDRYTMLRTTARETGAQVPTQSVRDVAVAQLEELSRKIVPGKSKLPKPLRKVSKALTELAELPPDVTWEQLDGAVDNFYASVSTAGKEGFSISSSAQVREAAETAVRNISEPGLAQQIQATDALWQQWMDLTKSPAGKQFGKVEKNFYRPGFKDAGTVYPDEFFEFALRSARSSPEAVRDLRRLVGQDGMNKMVRRHLETAFQAAESAAQTKQGGGIIDMQALRRSLGIGDEAAEQAMGEALKGSMVPFEKVKAFIDLLEDASALPVPDVSVFMARRATLGGVRSAAKALAGPGAAAFSATGAGLMDMSLVPIVLGTYGVRVLAKAIANPSRLKLASLALKRMKQDGKVSAHSAGMLTMALEGGLNDGSE